MTTLSDLENKLTIVLEAIGLLHSKSDRIEENQLNKFGSKFDEFESRFNKFDSRFDEFEVTFNKKMMDIDKKQWTKM